MSIVGDRNRRWYHRGMPLLAVCMGADKRGLTIAIVFILLMLTSPFVGFVDHDSTEISDNSSLLTIINPGDCYTGVDAHDWEWVGTWILNGSNLTTAGGECSGSLGPNDREDNYNIAIPAGKSLNITMGWQGESGWTNIELYYCTNQSGNCQTIDQVNPISHGSLIDLGGGTHWPNTPSLETGFDLAQGGWVTFTVEDSSLSTTKY